MREFTTGATRSSDCGKPDYEGYLSPLVMEAFGRYMLNHQTCEDGSERESDNWQKEIPKEQYLKSAWRHFLQWWKGHRGWEADDPVESLCALIFNVQGYLHELLKERMKAQWQAKQEIPNQNL